MQPILEIHGISKKFRIGHQSQQYLSFREKLTHLFSSNGSIKEDFWALQDVSFDVAPGESIGVIGKNGAGKSTLLKILSRITPPTAGRISCRGRMASLLEVGTGFHPELTGRENVFLNGSILGMRRKEIDKQFDEIVAFAGTEQFLDTPLKHYSSGMQLRLAFAVAAFLNPEILIIDEVLAVGDAEFQKKCLGKMEDVSRSGRTLLFVSHNMTAVENLCKRSILLQKGKVVEIGTSQAVIQSYLKRIRGSDAESVDLSTRSGRSGAGAVKFIGVEVRGEGKVIQPGMKLNFQIRLQNNTGSPISPFFAAVSIFDQQRVKLLTLDNLYTNQALEAKPGEFLVDCEVPYIGLMPGAYSIDLWCASHFETFDNIEEAADFTIEEGDIYGSGKVHNKAQHGYYLTPNNWKITS